MGNGWDMVIPQGTFAHFHRGQEIGDPNMTSEHLSNPNQSQPKKLASPP